MIHRILLAGHNGSLYRSHITGRADIAELIRVRESELENLTSTNGALDFWFTTSLHPAHWRINEYATEMLLTTTTFTGRTVPLLRGTVVIATHTPRGDISGFTEQQLNQLVATTPPRWPSIVLAHRYARERRRQHRQRRRLAAERETARIRALDESLASLPPRQ